MFSNMSEDKRKNARLQGRFSDEYRPKSKEKKKSKNDANRQDHSSSSTSTKGKNSVSIPCEAAEGFNLKYDENAKIPIEQLQEKKKPVEIKTSGIHVLSTTNNGESRVIFEPDFIVKEEADELFTILYSSTPWYDKNIIIHGKEHPQPRLVSWYGPYPYAYSGAVLDPLEMTPKLLDIKEKIEKSLHKWNIYAKFNSVLLNLYRNEKDSVAWHSDDELSLGINPVIASVSLGEVRKFEMSMKPLARDGDPNLVSTDYTVNLTPGSLIIMDGCMQKDWKHQVPKEYHDRGPRINLTFRTVKAKDEIPTKVPLKASVDSNNLSYSEAEEKKHIFDDSSFPPLNASSSEGEKYFNKSSNSLPETKVTNAVELSTSESEKTVPNYSSENAENQSVELTFNTYEENVSSQDVDITSTTCSAMADNGDTLEVPEKAEDEEVYSVNNNLDSDLLNNHPVPELQEQNEVSLSAVEESNSYKRSQLNAEATEFVPKCHNVLNGGFTPLNFDYNSLNILELVDLFDSGNVSFPQFDDFSKALNNKIKENGELFSHRDHYELDVLCSINDSAQIEKHWKTILARLCSMINHAARYNTVPRNNSRSSSRTYRDNYGSRYRNNGYRNEHRNNGYKGKGFKD